MGVIPLLYLTSDDLGMSSLRKGDVNFDSGDLEPADKVLYLSCLNEDRFSGWNKFQGCRSQCGKRSTLLSMNKWTPFQKVKTKIEIKTSVLDIHCHSVSWLDYRNF